MSDSLLTYFSWLFRTFKNRHLLPSVILWGIGRSILLWHKLIISVQYSNAIASWPYWRTTDRMQASLLGNQNLHILTQIYFSNNHLLTNHAIGNTDLDSLSKHASHLPFLFHCLWQTLYPKYLLPIPTW